jgi:hypothetical protein
LHPAIHTQMVMFLYLQEGEIPELRFTWLD